MRRITIRRARTWHYRKMRPCIEQSNGPVSLSLSQSCPDCIINTSGYDFRKGQGLDISILGFEPVEIDQLQTDFEEHAADPKDNIDPTWCEAFTVSKPGDLWVLGNHKLLCGDARSARDIARLMTGCRADLAFLDPPYNVRIGGVVGRGNTKHSEFAMASGEMSSPDFVLFLGSTLDAAASVSREGAVHFVCMDWRHIAELMAAAKPVYGATLNLVVWAKTNSGQGSFYRSAHELIGRARTPVPAEFDVIEVRSLTDAEHAGHGYRKSRQWFASCPTSLQEEPRAPGAPFAPPP